MTTKDAGFPEDTRMEDAGLDTGPEANDLDSTPESAFAPTSAGLRASKRTRQNAGRLGS